MDRGRVPRRVHGGWFDDEALPAGEFLVDVAQLARVHARYAGHLGQTPISQTTLGLAALRVGSNDYGHSSPLVEFPLERNEHYYSPHDEVRWITSIWASGDDFTQNYLLNGAPTVFEAGRRHEQPFNAPIHVATLADARPFDVPAARQGDTLSVFPPTDGDGDGHEGLLPTTGRTRLYRDGELVAEVASGSGGALDVPPGLASYRIEIDTVQSAGGCRAAAPPAARARARPAAATRVLHRCGARSRPVSTGPNDSVG